MTRWAVVPLSITTSRGVASNVLVYKSVTNFAQVGLASKTVLALPPVAGSGQCSISLSNSQFLVVQGGVVSTVNTLQQECGYGLTSPVQYAVSKSSCVACPAPPANAYFVVGDPVCAWECYTGFQAVGSVCSKPPLLQCPSYFYPNGHWCQPAVQPWAPAGSYATGINVSALQSWRSLGAFLYVMTAYYSTGVSYMATARNIYWTVSSQWSAVSVTAPACLGLELWRRGVATISSSSSPRV